MEASQFTDGQKAFIIKQGEDGTPVAEICRPGKLQPSPRADHSVTEFNSDRGHLRGQRQMIHGSSSCDEDRLGLPW